MIYQSGRTHSTKAPLRLTLREGEIIIFTSNNANRHMLAGENDDNGCCTRMTLLFKHTCRLLYVPLKISLGTTELQPHLNQLKIVRINNNNKANKKVSLCRVDVRKWFISRAHYLLGLLHIFSCWQDGRWADRGRVICCSELGNPAMPTRPWSRASC